MLGQPKGHRENGMDQAKERPAQAATRRPPTGPPQARPPSSRSLRRRQRCPRFQDSALLTFRRASAPNTPKISGVAMRRMPPRRFAQQDIAGCPSCRAFPCQRGRCGSGQKTRQQERKAATSTRRDRQITRHAHGPAHAVGTDKTGCDEKRRHDHANGDSPASIATTMPVKPNPGDRSAVR